MSPRRRWAVALIALAAALTPPATASALVSRGGADVPFTFSPNVNSPPNISSTALHAGPSNGSLPTFHVGTGEGAYRPNDGFVGDDQLTLRSCSTSTIPDPLGGLIVSNSCNDIVLAFQVRPATSIAVDAVTDATPEITYSASVRNATLSGLTGTCVLDGGAPFACDGGSFTPADPLADGQHTISIAAAKDGFADPSPPTADFLVDGTPPVVELVTGPSGPTADRSPSWGFAATDRVGGPAPTTACRLVRVGETAPVFAPCSETFSATDLADGTYQLEVRGTDDVGNQSTSTRQVVIDGTAPVVTITAGPSGTTAERAASFAFTAVDRDDGPAPETTCRLVRSGAEAPEFAPCASAASYDGLVDGSYVLEVRAVDDLGNAGLTSRAFVVATPPVEPPVVEPGPSPGPAPAPSPGPSPGPGGGGTTPVLALSSVRPTSARSCATRVVAAVSVRSSSPSRVTLTASAKGRRVVRAVVAVKAGTTRVVLCAPRTVLRRTKAPFAATVTARASDGRTAGVTVRFVRLARR